MSESLHAKYDTSSSSMNRNGPDASAIRTTLRGGSGGSPSLGQNRLRTGFGQRTAIYATDTSSEGGSRQTTKGLSTHNSMTGESPNEAIEISDDTDVEEHSDDGGILINVDHEEDESYANTEQDADVPDQISDGEVAESDYEPEPGQVSQPALAYLDEHGSDDAHIRSQGELDRSDAMTAKEIAKRSGPFTVDAGGSRTKRLADLSPEDLERQIKYTLFGLDRNQIDLSRPVICTSCLQEGHLGTTCPEANCSHAGHQNKHSSRMCPRIRRCLRCRERGHDVDDCTAKLCESDVICDFCGADHLEDVCLNRFFPAQRQMPQGEVSLWVSCSNCASRTHLVGDCPSTSITVRTMRWSLRALDPNKVVNLSLQSGIRKMEQEAENRCLRPPGQAQRGLQMKGRGLGPRQRSPPRRHSDSSNEHLLRPRVGGRSAPTMQNHIRFDTHIRDFRDERADYDADHNRGSSSYRPDPQYARDTTYNYNTSRPGGPSASSRPDRYPPPPPPSTSRYSDPSSFYRPREEANSFSTRRRSRSPDRRGTPAPQQAGGSSWVAPPLPRGEPLPQKPPRPKMELPHTAVSKAGHQQALPDPPPATSASNGKQGGSATQTRKARRRGLKSTSGQNDGNGNGSGSGNGDRDIYRPMPSAGKQAWDKHRL